MRQIGQKNHKHVYEQDGDTHALDIYVTEAVGETKNNGDHHCKHDIRSGVAAMGWNEMHVITLRPQSLGQ